MPIRGFDQYNQAPCTQKMPITVLSETIIAIDGFWYLKKYMPFFNESSLLDFTSALESTLAPLANFAKTTQVIWIWDGLDFDHPVFIKDDLHSKALDTIKRLEANKPVKCIFDQEIFVDHATRFLELNRISVVRAPYLAMAQCVYFLRENCVKYIFTKTDALFFKDGHKVVTDINYESRTIEIVDRSELFKINNFNLYGFQALSFLSGCELIPTIPIYAFEFSLSKIFELIKIGDFEAKLLEFYNQRTNSSISSVDDADFMLSEEGAYIKSFYRAFIIVESHPILALSGRLESLDGSDMPSDFESVFGSRLSDAIYQDLFKCNIGPKLINKVVFNGSFNESYKQNILDKFKDILCNGIAGRELFTSELIKQIFKMNISWSENINKSVQILSFLLCSEDFEPESMINFINSGIIDRSKHVSSSDRKASRALKSNDLYFYLKMLDAVTIFSDLVKLIRMNSVVENDLGINFILSDLLIEINRSEVEKFLKKNLLRFSKLKEIFDIL